MKDPRFQEAQKKQIDDATRKAFNSFLLISVDYLYRNLEQDKDDILKYIEFVVMQMHFVEKDDEYFTLLNDALKDETGINILGNTVK